MSQNNLPTHATSFVGRQSELDDISKLLAESSCQLLTLVGLGGVGKTRLAIEIAHRVQNLFPDGVYFVPLQPLQNPNQIIQAILHELNLETDRDPHTHLLSYLSERQLLLVLDNFEHLIEGINLLGEILNNTVKVKIMVTSRESLQLQEEWIRQIYGLHYPDDMASSMNGHFDAVQLFKERAQQLRADLDSYTQYPYIVNICQLVEGLPLAIEMAASWLSVLTCQDVVDRIEHGRLDSRLRNIPERHRSMSAVFEQTWELLTDEERDVFCKLSVFADGFRKEAAEVITQATPHMLATLVDKSLLQLDASGRYNLHELLRQFGMEKLDKHSQKKAAVLDAHCDYYTAFLIERKDRFRAQDSSEVMEELSKEIDNIRFAWEHVIDSNKTLIMRETIWCLTEYYEIQNWYREGDYMLRKVVDALKTKDVTGTRGIALGLALVGRGNLLHYLGRLDEAKVLIREGVSILKHRDAFAETAHALSLLGRCAWMTGDFEIANQAYRDSITLAEDTGDLVTLGFGYLNLSMIAVIEGNFQQSTQLKQTALATFQQINHQLGIGIILCIKGEEQYLLGYYEQAKDFVLRASKIFIELDNQWHLSNCSENMGHIMFALGDYTNAVYHLSEAMRLAQEINDPRRITYCHVNLGDVLYAYGKIHEANQHYSNGLTLARETHQRLQEAWSLRGLGAIAYHDANYDLARQYSSDSLNICREIGWKIGVIKALNLLGLTASRRGEMGSAGAYFVEALDTAILIKANPIILETLIYIADMLIDFKDMKSAVQILSGCSHHAAIHADMRKRSDHSLSKLRKQLSADIFARLKDRSRATELSAVAKMWRNQVEYVAQLSIDVPPLLEQLTRTERKILMLMDSDLSFPEIAELQHVSINTIKSHRKNIYTKLGVNSRAEAVERAKILDTFDT